jgi:hypothetical protein
MINLLEIVTIHGAVFQSPFNPIAMESKLDLLVPVE